MLTFVTLRELPDGSFEYKGIQAGPDMRPDGNPAFVPPEPTGHRYVAVNYASYSEFINPPLVAGKDYQATIKLEGSKATDLKNNTSIPTTFSDFDLVDVEPKDSGS